MKRGITKLERALRNKKFIDLSTIMPLEKISVLTGICEEVIKKSCSFKKCEGMYLKIATLICEKAGVTK